MSMKSWTDLFSLTLILNLEFRDDRRKEIKEELRNVGMDVSGSVQFFKAIRPQNKGKFPSIGARGCFESHLAMLKKAKSEGVNNLLIIEDDLQFNKLFNLDKNFYINEIGSLNWDIIYFGYHIEQSEPDSKDRGYVLLKHDMPVGATHFYAVNANMLDPLIEFLELVQSRDAGDPNGGPMHVDGALTTFRLQNPSVRTFLAKPCLGFQRPSKTDIGDVHFLDKFESIAPIVSFLRKFKRKLLG